jgi:hypothetical protein
MLQNAGYLATTLTLLSSRRRACPAFSAGRDLSRVVHTRHANALYTILCHPEGISSVNATPWPAAIVLRAGLFKAKALSWEGRVAAKAAVGLVGRRREILQRNPLDLRDYKGECMCVVHPFRVPKAEALGWKGSVSRLKPPWQRAGRFSDGVLRTYGMTKFIGHNAHA